MIFNTLIADGNIVHCITIDYIVKIDDIQWFIVPINNDKYYRDDENLNSYKYVMFPKDAVPSREKACQDLADKLDFTCLSGSSDLTRMKYVGVGEDEFALLILLGALPWE